MSSSGPEVGVSTSGTPVSLGRLVRSLKYGAEQQVRRIRKNIYIKNNVMSFYLLDFDLVVEILFINMLYYNWVGIYI